MRRRARVRKVARRPNSPTVATVAGVKVMVFYSDAPPHVHLSKGDMDIVFPSTVRFCPRGHSRRKNATRSCAG